MSNILQSAYKQFNSTETALLKVHSDVTLNMDKVTLTDSKLNLNANKIVSYYWYIKAAW